MSGGDWKDAYKAVETGDLDLLKFYIREGIDINYQHPEVLMSLLVTAIKNNFTDLAILLIENGADPHLESYYDQLTPMEAALKLKNKAVLEKFKKMGVRPTLYQRLKFFF